MDNQNIEDLHNEIADILHNTPNSVRKLEEQTYHLFMAKSYFKLKEIISTIENFLLLFNPNNKYDLCRYWQKLEEQGFDPVIEYNKAIEGFQMHYRPSSENVFRIIVQCSRFLKEFGDFETYFTPEFRHPPIRGLYEELDDIGLLKEIQGLSLFISIDPSSKKQRIEKQEKSPKQKIQEKMAMLKSKKLKTQDADKSISPVQNQEFDKNVPRKVNILSEIEKLNIDVPSNREQFRKYFLEKMNL